MSSICGLPPLPLPEGVTSRQIDTSPIGLSFHVLEAGYTPARDRSLIVLLHGFPELAFSWRKVMPLLADAGFYVVAPDQRGYGRTTGWDTRDFENVDMRSFSVLSLIRDVVVLVHALGYRSVKCVVGHDFGAVPAALCALARPDFFQSVLLMSHPFKGAPSLPFDTVDRKRDVSSDTTDIHAELATQGRKHYKWYYSTQQANSDMVNPPQGLHEFLRGYFHVKSGAWSGNNPYPLNAWIASELAKMPYYYIMPLSATMPQSIAIDMAKESPSSAQASKTWLPDSDLSVYVSEYARTGFQGGLNWYRCQTESTSNHVRGLDIFAGKKIECPSAFISGRQDWGTYQEPGAIEKMSTGEVYADFRGITIVEGAGHWVPQEKPDEVARAILALVRNIGDGSQARSSARF